MLHGAAKLLCVGARALGDADRHSAAQQDCCTSMRTVRTSARYAVLDTDDCAEDDADASCNMGVVDRCSRCA